MAKEVIVVGAGVGGLSAAIHARLAGHQVLVLEQHEHCGGKAAGISIKGYRLDPGPSIVILTRVYEDLFRKAGCRLKDYLNFDRLDPISRIYFEGEPPWDLPADREEAIRMLRELAPEDAQAFERVMDKLDRVAPLIDRSIFKHPYDQPWQLADPKLALTALQFDLRATYKELIDRHFRSPMLRSFFYGFPSYGGQTYDSKAPGALMIPYLMLAEGVWYPQGGVAAIPAAMERLARELGVEIRTGVKVVGLEVKDNRVGAVTTATGERHTAEAFISNVDRLTTRAWLGHKVEWSPSLSYFTVHWGFSRILDGLRHHTLFVPREFERGFEQLYRDRVFPDEPIVYVNATHEADPAAAPPNSSNVFAVVTSPAQEIGLDWSERKTEYRDRIVATLRRLGLNLNPNEAEFERIQTPDYFEQAHGNYQGSLYGPDEQHRILGGLFPHRNWDEDYVNLFYCGGSVQPGAGLPMVTLSGKFAADALDHRRY